MSCRRHSTHRPLATTGSGKSSAENIRILRQAESWRLEDLSAALSKIDYPMSVKVLSKTENGLRSISTNDLVAFARVFRVDVSRLITPTTESRGVVGNRV